MSGGTTTSSLEAQLSEQEPVTSNPLEYTPPSSPSLEPTDESAEVAKNGATVERQPKGRAEGRYRLNELGLLQGTRSQDIVGTIVSCLQKVHEQMKYLEEYIKDQGNSGKPLHQWQKYGSYSQLSTAVSKLEEATAKFKIAPLYSREQFAILIARTTLCSTSVSQAAVYVMSAISKKTEDYMWEMERSSLSDEAKTEANAAITKETQKLLEHSTRATEHVWRATDLLRTCKQRREQKDWLWSTAATAMHVFIAAVVGIFTVFLFSPVTSIGSDPASSHVLDVVQQTQAITNLTGEIYDLKLQGIGQRVNDIGALSEANGLRLDNLVDSLGAPNEHGMWYVSQPSSNDKSCEIRLQQVSDSLGRELYRQKQELEGLRNSVHRMDIRLTQEVRKLKK